MQGILAILINLHDSDIGIREAHRWNEDSAVKSSVRIEVSLYSWIRFPACLYY